MKHWAALHKKQATYTVNRFLPLALLLLTMRLPCFVDILFKNPWVLARFTLLG
jgi:hypothetical protein